MSAPLFLAAGFLAFCAQGPYDLELRDIEGDVLLSLRAREADLGEILRDVAARTQKQLVGLERLGRSEPIHAELVDRPLGQALHALVGVAGARVRVHPGAIEVYADLAGGASVEELEEQAAVAYLRALQAHPEHHQGAHAELVLGELQTRRGNLRAAVGHYELLVRDHDQSELVPEALWRAGGLLVKLAEWPSAAAKFTALANHPVDHIYAARARMELARCLVQAGDARQALLLLDALANLFPTTDLHETRTRAFLSALALHGVGRRGEALEALTRAEGLGGDTSWDAEATELRAETFEYFGRHAEAARAWLKCAELAGLPERAAFGGALDRERALVHAARLSELASDPIAVLMIERLVARTPAAPRVEAYAARAREELGLVATTAAARLDGAITRALGHLGAHLPQLAAQELERQWLERERLDEGERARLASVYARALDEHQGLEPALRLLRSALAELFTEAARKEVLIAAGELFERHERFDDAAAAYGGRL